MHIGCFYVLQCHNLITKTMILSRSALMKYVIWENHGMTHNSEKDWSHMCSDRVKDTQIVHISGQITNISKYMLPPRKINIRIGKDPQGSKQSRPHFDISLYVPSRHIFAIIDQHSSNTVPMWCICGFQVLRLPWSPVQNMSINWKFE